MNKHRYKYMIQKASSSHRGRVSETTFSLYWVFYFENWPDSLCCSSDGLPAVLICSVQLNESCFWDVSYQKETSFHLCQGDYGINFPELDPGIFRRILYYCENWTSQVKSSQIHKLQQEKIGTSSSCSTIYQTHLNPRSPLVPQALLVTGFFKATTTFKVWNQ